VPGSSPFLRLESVPRGESCPSRVFLLWLCVSICLLSSSLFSLFLARCHEVGCSYINCSLRNIFGSIVSDLNRASFFYFRGFLSFVPLAGPASSPKLGPHALAPAFLPVLFPFITSRAIVVSISLFLLPFFFFSLRTRPSRSGVDCSAQNPPRSLRLVWVPVWQVFSDFSFFFQSGFCMLDSVLFKLAVRASLSPKSEVKSFCASPPLDIPIPALLE